MYTKHNFLVGKIASRSGLKLSLRCVAFFGDRTVATDSFRLIEVSATGKKKKTPVLYRADLLKVVKLKKGETLDDASIPVPPESAEEQYPDIDRVFKDAEADEHFELNVNAEYLEELCSILKTINPHNIITLQVPKRSGRPIVMTAKRMNLARTEIEQTARALVMPIVK